MYINFDREKHQLKEIKQKLLKAVIVLVLDQQILMWG